MHTLMLDLDLLKSKLFSVFPTFSTPEQWIPSPQSPRWTMYEHFALRQLHPNSHRSNPRDMRARDSSNDDDDDATDHTTPVPNKMRIFLIILESSRDRPRSSAWHNTGYSFIVVRSVLTDWLVYGRRFSSDILAFEYDDDRKRAVYCFAAEITIHLLHFTLLY